MERCCPSARPSLMKPHAAVLVALVLLTGCAPGESSAACAGPSAVVSPGTAAVADDLLVTGSGFGDGPCNDTGQVGWRERWQARKEPKALRDLPVTLEQDGRTWQLGQVDAAEDTYDLRLTVRVPEGVQPGRARIRVGPASPVRVALVDR